MATTDDEGRWPVEARREAVAMALYACLVLSAEFVAFGHAGTTRADALALVWGSVIGLTLAHIFAFDVAARLFASGRLGPTQRIAVVLQLVAAISVATVASIPFLVFPVATAAEVAAFAVAALVGLAGYLVFRAAGVQRLRSLVYGAAAFAVAEVIVGLKVALSH